MTSQHVSEVPKGEIRMVTVVLDAGSLAVVLVLVLAPVPQGRAPGDRIATGRQRGSSASSQTDFLPGFRLHHELSLVSGAGRQWTLLSLMRGGRV
jgi:hypothetical protein